MIKLFPHQSEALNITAGKNRVAYYHDMGLGKTFTGAEKLNQLKGKVNLVICQKSKINDWIEHFETHYYFKVYDLTKPKQLNDFHGTIMGERFTAVGIINYDLVFRRSELMHISFDTLMLDESSLIQNEQTKRSKFILKYLSFKNVILLSGTPTGGKYEKLYSQLKLLGWETSKKTFYNTYVDYHYDTFKFAKVPIMVIDGYKNVERLKRKMREYGCHFLKSEDVLDLPEQIFTTVKVPVSKDYRKFRKDRVVSVDSVKLIGDTTLTKLLYERQLCGQYSKEKAEAFKDLVESTEDRLIVFYNFNGELETIKKVASELGKELSIVNGQAKDLTAYKSINDSITAIQYQAGAMGLNLQLSNKIIYYSPPLSSELYEQSKKRINRIGQSRTCYYYNLTVQQSVETKIYKVLEMRKDFTEALFEEEI